jgi:tetratricopeptide (TPR) repeat protein
LSNERNSAIVALVVSVLAVVGVAVSAQDTPSDDELSRHLTTVRAQVEDRALHIARREELVLEMAATLDRTAQASSAPEVRRRRWSEAIDLLDWFVKDNPGPPRERQLRFQAAVFRWAQANSWMQTWQLAPTDSKLRAQAATALDDAIDRFRAVSGDGNTQSLVDNLRFRLAEALADRADLEPLGSADRRSRESESLGLMDEPLAELGLAGYWHLLKGDLSRRLGKPAEAEKELDAAIKADPPAPEREVFDVQVPLRIAAKQFTQALKAIESSHLDGPIKAFWMVRVRLAQLAGMSEGGERFAVETELFRSIKTLRGGTAPETRLALLDLAQSGIVPDSRHEPEVWDSLADAYGTAGDPAKAGAQMERAAKQAAARGKVDVAAAFLLRGGAYLFQAGRFREADALLSRVADDPAAGALRAKAGMLRALSRGRAWALHLAGASTASYQKALEQQVRDFPRDPSTDEARWLLGGLALSSADRDRALSFWSTIAIGSSRWLDSRLAIADLDNSELEVLLINPVLPRVTERFERADRFLTDSIREARGENATSELLLARARLNLTPIVGKPAIARELCERVTQLPGSRPLHYRARLYRLVALVESARYVEAEREASSHSSWSIGAPIDVQLDAVRLLDRCATLSETDLRQRRFGLVLRLILESMIADDGGKSPEQLGELRMHMTRALLFVGADREARSSLSAWRGVPAASSDRVLRDLGDTYSRLEVYSLDIDVQRLRLKNNTAGSPSWFDARYALALAYFHTGRLKDAAQLIDSTAILHPELGGGDLHDKFIRLRQRLGIKP